MLGRFMPLQLAAGGGMALALFAFNRYIGIDRWYHLAAAGLLGLGAYLAVLVLVRAFTRKDMNFFLATLNPLHMKDYIRDELRGDKGSE